MSDEVIFPVYVLGKDCGEVTEYPSLGVMKGYFEAVDVENDVWDGTGYPLKLTVLDANSGWLSITRSNEPRIPDEQFTELKATAKQYREPKGLFRTLFRR
jgi:hypothetical protein